MKECLEFTYDKPDETAAPLCTVNTQRSEPVSIRWTPDINCSSAQYEKGITLAAPPNIPWHQINIAEIWVESRKAYEVLAGIVPAGQEFLVRILPQEPDPQSDQLFKKVRDVVMFTNGDALEMDLAKGISAAALVSSCPDSDLVEQAALVVFCHRSASSSTHLCEAIECGCDIVSSDAGTAEEYLACYASPGSWHVAKSWQAKEWLNMILDLQGKTNEVCQTSNVDETPYIKAWEDQ